MKVLFLDIDGVLNSADWFHKLDPKVGGAIHELDPKPLARVLRVLETTGAALVLSSTWRIIPELVTLLKAKGLPIVDCTPRSPNGHRGDEITEYLNQHPEIETFAIIDDDSDAGQSVAATPSGKELEGRFVKTHWKHGMYGKHEKHLVALLGEAESKGKSTGGLE